MPFELYFENSYRYNASSLSTTCTSTTPKLNYLYQYYTHGYRHTYKHTQKYVYMHACMSVCVYECVCVCVFVCVCMSRTYLCKREEK